MSGDLLVTSFSPEGADQYGLRCVQSFRQYWPQPMVVYVDESIKITGVDVRLTRRIPYWKDTRKCLPSAGRDFGYKPDSYLWNAAKFAVKPFVWLDAAERMEEGVLTWVDGDTVATRAVTRGFAGSIIDGSDVAYLGRGVMHPEMSYVSFRIPEALPLLWRCCHLYVSGDFRNLTDGWTDCHVFRAALQAADMQDIRNNSLDLTSNRHKGAWRSTVDAMALSPLGPYVKHLKGSLKAPEKLESRD